MCKSEILKSTGFVFVLVCMLTSPCCWAATIVIYSDDFSGSGLLDGTAPDVRPGQETWIAAEVYGADGSVDPNTLDGLTYQALLPFSPQAGKIYTLSLDVDPQSSVDPGTWFALGFTNSNVTASSDYENDQFYTTGIAWILHRVSRDMEENDEIQTFLGPGMTEGEDESHESKEEGLVTLSVVLDTTASQWTVEWLRNNHSLRGPVAFDTNPEISYVGFTKFWVTAGIVDNFELNVADDRFAYDPNPLDRAKDVPSEVILTWRPGIYTAGLSPKHRIFFSDSFGNVSDGVGGIEQDAERYPVSGTLNLDFGKTYYWRIDEANSTTGWDVGDVWRFKVVDSIVVDDFENYNNESDRVFMTWKGGYGYTGYCGNGTGSTVGHDIWSPDSPYDDIMETSIVNSGNQSMPVYYDNTGTTTNFCGEQINLYYSEIKRTLDVPQDWTGSGVKALSLWFMGISAYLGSFSEGPPGTYTMTGEGEDIWGQSDEFHFAWKELSGAGSITAKVESVENTDEWAKAGVMIRDTLDANSPHAMVGITPGNGLWFGRRREAGGDSDDDSLSGIAAPYWVRLECTTGGLCRAYYSEDSSEWTQFGLSEAVPMVPPMYIGLALTSHNSGVACEAIFSNVTSDGTGEWVNQDIGLTRNRAEPMYIVISDSSGTSGTIDYDDPNATVIDTWKEWNIDFKEIEDQGVVLSDVNSIAIGFGDRDNQQAGGSGLMYIDDIRLYQPRCISDKITLSEADLNSDCVVDLRDLEKMAEDWLEGDYAIAATTPKEPAISWWEFEDNVDDSVGVNHGIIYGDPTFVVGKSGQAISLDGGDYIDCGNSSTLDFGTDDWTISAWIKTTQYGSTEEDIGTVFAKGGDGAGGIRYALALNEAESGKITLTTDDNETKAQTTNDITVNDDEWHHVAGVRIGDELRLYVDAVFDNIRTLPKGYDLFGTSQHNAYIGVIRDNENNSLFKYYIGLIDDLQIYDYALRYSDIIGAAGLTEVYYPLTSAANLSDEEPNKSKKVNLKDYGILADEWLEQQPFWPE